MEAEGEDWDPVKLAQAPQKFISDRSKAVLSLLYFLFFTSKCFCFNNEVSYRYRQLCCLGNTVADNLERVDGYASHVFFFFFFSYLIVLVCLPFDVESLV